MLNQSGEKSMEKKKHIIFASGLEANVQRDSFFNAKY